MITSQFRKLSCSYLLFAGHVSHYLIIRVETPDSRSSTDAGGVTLGSGYLSRVKFSNAKVCSTLGWMLKTRPGSQVHERMTEKQGNIPTHGRCIYDMKSMEGMPEGPAAQSPESGKGKAERGGILITQRKRSKDANMTSSSSQPLGPCFWD